MTEKELIHMLQEKNDSAIEHLQTNYGPLIRYIIAPILTDKSDQDEVFNDVLLRVWEKIDSFDSTRGNWTNWLSTIARNTAIDKARKNASHIHQELDETYTANNIGPEPELLHKELKTKLYLSLRSLPNDEYILFYRKYYYRQSTAQIAAEYGTTERAIEGKLYRIKQKLRKMLGGEIYV